MEVWPFAATANVLRGIGTSAFKPGHGAGLRSHQATLVVAWSGVPTDEAAERFAGISGHLIATAKGNVYGVLPLAEARPLGALTALTREVGEALGAQPLGYERSLPLPGVRGTEFLTDPLSALRQEPATAEDIVAAGLRSSATPGVDA